MLKGGHPRFWKGFFWVVRPTCGVAQTRPPTEAVFYRLKRAKYLVCNIYDATLKIIAVAKVKANIVIHICSSIAWQAGARTVSQPPAPGLSSSRWTGRSR
jgi:hypothetical protein